MTDGADRSEIGTDAGSDRVGLALRWILRGIDAT